MGVNKIGISTPRMLELELILFTYPEETGCCPFQPSKDYNMRLSITMSQVKIVFVTERTIRIIDYIMF